MGRVRVAVALAVVVGLLAAAASAFAYQGLRLTNPGGTLRPTGFGTIYPRFSCPSGTDLYCTGTLTIKAGRSTVLTAPIAVRGNDNPSHRFPLSRAWRDRIQRAGRLRVTFIMRTHDAAGEWRTTTGSMTIVRR